MINKVYYLFLAGKDRIFEEAGVGRADGKLKNITSSLPKTIPFSDKGYAP